MRKTDIFRSVKTTTVPSTAFTPSTHMPRLDFNNNKADSEKWQKTNETRLGREDVEKFPLSVF